MQNIVNNSDNNNDNSGFDEDKGRFFIDGFEVTRSFFKHMYFLGYYAQVEKHDPQPIKTMSDNGYEIVDVIGDREFKFTY